MNLKKKVLFGFGFLFLSHQSFASCQGLGAKQKSEMTGKMIEALIDSGFTNSTQLPTAAAILVCKKRERSFTQMAGLLRKQFDELRETAGVFNIPENVTAAASLID